MGQSQRLPHPRQDVRVLRPAEALAWACDTVLWRWLLIMQSLRARYPWLLVQLRRAALLVWWTVTLQLPTQFGYWRQARARRRAARQQAAPPLIAAVDPTAIAVPYAARPVVSVIIPSYGQAAFTLRCLASIMLHPPVAAIEVIVVDDAFPGDEIACVAQVRGIRLQRNSANLGFLRACNAAATQARGEFLLFLNNDTQVLPGWADAMLTLFRTRDDVGAVGSKLLYPDGTLQEAGGIIWRDGSGWNFGRHDDPDKPLYNHVREVDYCSGASLMVRRAVFADLDGFDETFAPAYYEDTDLCFRLRAMGLKTLYQPGSVVVHCEGVSHGRALTAGVKARQPVNRRKFVRRWAAVLARDHYPNGSHVLRARDQARHRMVALVVDHQVPEPDRDAGSRAMVCLIRSLLGDGMVVKFWPFNLLYKPGYVEALQQLGVEVMHGPQQVPCRPWLQENGREIDLVVLSRPDVAEVWLPLVRAYSAARVAYYGHDLHFSRMGMQGMLMQDETLLRAADRMEGRERAIWLASDVVLYLSEEEAASVRLMEPTVTARAVVPYCFEEFGVARSAPAEHTLLFVAGFGHPPNEDAACWLVRTVLPLVHARVPDAVLSIVGSNPTLLVQELAGDAVRVVPDVADRELLGWYRRARVAVVPLRCGAGVKLKVVEALKEGVPLVTTPVGAQGLPELAGTVFIHADAAAFAASVCDLLLNDALWARRCAGQIEYARQRFSVETLHASVRAAIETAGATQRSAAPRTHPPGAATVDRAACCEPAPIAAFPATVRTTT